jgi:hypothetical protein
MSTLRWAKKGEAFVCESWTPDLIEDRNERLGWMMRNNIPWSVLNAQLIPRGGREVTHLLDEAMKLGRGEWKTRLRALEAMGVATAAEGTYAALAAYPLEAELAAVNSGTTENSLLTVANATLYMPIPARSVLAPQAWRFVVSGRVTTTATAANLTWTNRLGNANTSPSLGASAALAKTISITNAYFIEKGDITVQSVGAAGTNARAMGHFQMFLNSASGGAAIIWVWGSSAQASFDSTVAPGASANGGQVWLGMLASAAAADPLLTSQVHWMDWN